MLSMKDNSNALEWEAQENLEFICTHHSQERLKEFQESWNPNSLMVGDHIKTSFEGNTKCGEPMVEHMWVKVIHINKDEIEGILDNVPVWVSEFELGDKVIVKHTDVQDHYPCIRNLSIDHG